MKNLHPTILILTVLALLLIGCEPEVRVVRSSWDNFPADPKPTLREGDDPYADPAGGQGWSIQLIELSGNNRHEQAKQLIEDLRDRASLSDLWIEDTGQVAYIYHGRFADASDPAIRPALSTLKGVEIGEDKPFAKCKLVPLVGGSRVIADPFDLRQFSGYYSLQIGFYDEAFGKEFRSAAEDAVRSLREEGNEAYFYHGPFRSIITIGVFNYEQAFVRAGNVDAYAPQIKALQEKFPYNLGNGNTITQSMNGQDLGEQKSSLIRVY